MKDFQQVCNSAELSQEGKLKQLGDYMDASQASCRYGPCSARLIKGNMPPLWVGQHGSEANRIKMKSNAEGSLSHDASEAITMYHVLQLNSTRRRCWGLCAGTSTNAAVKS